MDREQSPVLNGGNTRSSIMDKFVIPHSAELKPLICYFIILCVWGGHFKFVQRCPSKNLALPPPPCTPHKNNKLGIMI